MNENSEKSKFFILDFQSEIGNPSCWQGPKVHTTDR